MALTLSQLQAQLDKLETALHSGYRTVTYADGRSVTFKTQDEMERAVSSLKASIAGASGSRRIRRRVVIFHKGL